MGWKELSAVSYQLSACDALRVREGAASDPELDTDKRGFTRTQERFPFHVHPWKTVSYQPLPQHRLFTTVRVRHGQRVRSGDTHPTAKSDPELDTDQRG